MGTFIKIDNTLCRFVMPTVGESGLDGGDLRSDEIGI